ncbi:hypothetical protein ULF88_08350 [Halopseudomonas pachastrellae]|nr:hypothetical protein [Halopseudomonas pachastrellae]
MLHTAISNTRNVRRTLTSRLADMRRTGYASRDIDVMDYSNGNVALSSDLINSLQQARGGAASADRRGGLLHSWHLHPWRLRQLGHSRRL